MTSRECLRLRGEREFVVQPLAVPNPEEAAGDEATGVARGGGGTPLRGARRRGPGRLRPDRGEHRGGGHALPPTRWVAAGDRAGGALGQGAPPGSLGRAARAPPAAAGRGRWRSAGSPADDAGHDRLELPAPPARGAAAVSAAGGLRRGVHPGGRRRRSGETTARPSTLALVAALVDKSLVRPQTASGRRDRASFRDVGDDPRVRPGATRGQRRGSGDPRSARPLLHAPGRDVAPSRLGHKRVHSTNSRPSTPMCAPPWSGSMPKVRSPTFVHLASLLPGFWSRGGHLREGRTWLERAVAKAEVAAADDRGRVQVGLGVVLTWQGELEAAEPLFAAGIPLLRASGNDPGPGDRAELAWHLGQFPRTTTPAPRSCSAKCWLWQRRPATSQAAINVQSQCPRQSRYRSPSDRGDFALAETRLAEALRLRDAHGFDLAAAVSVVGLAAVAYARGDYHLAIERYRESLARFGERGELQSCGVRACRRGVLGRGIGSCPRRRTPVRRRAGGPRAGGDARVRTGLAGQRRSPPRRRAGRPRRRGVRDRLGRGPHPLLVRADGRGRGAQRVSLRRRRQPCPRRVRRRGSGCNRRMHHRD